MENKIQDWNIQIKRGTLELCILKILNLSPKYGYEILQILNEHPIISSKESTVYPLLRRLEKEKLLSSYWQESTQGLPPRKYYQITKTGKQYLELIITQWETLQKTIKTLG